MIQSSKAPDYAHLNHKCNFKLKKKIHNVMMYDNGFFLFSNIYIYNDWLEPGRR